MDARDSTRPVSWEVRHCAGWGRTTTATVPMFEPTTVTALRKAVSDRAVTSVLAFGGGRSYGDNAVNSNGAAIATRSLNRVVSFDEQSGELVCEAGITYRQLVEKYLPKGFVVPVSPGTSFATIGGAIANDVHGKNHDHAGSLGLHVNWLDLICADGSILRASMGQNQPQFLATIGGLGLTGIIAQVSINLDRIGTDSVVVQEHRITDLDDFMEQLATARAHARYSVGWIDLLKKGSGLGRGILETADLSSGIVGYRPRRRLRVPITLPGGVLNSQTVRIFNSLYYRRIPPAGRERVISYDQFTYPLDAIQDWNRIYGSRGFFQFQCVLPEEESSRGLQRLLDIITRAKAASFLAVLKTLGSPGIGLLSFPIRGFTLALDIPRKSGSLEIMQDLEKATLDHGGRVYLAKDAVLSSSGFRKMYPKIQQFAAMLEQLDPERRFQSDMAVRLGLRTGR